MVLNVLLVASCWLVAALGAICPADWQRYGESCYHLLNERMSWHDANRTCVRLGASLTLPVSSDEQDFIWQMFLQMATTNGLWIGCNDISIEGKWQPCPLKNETNDYENWKSGLPDNNHDGADCAVAARDWSGKWNDMQCHWEKQAICKFQINSTANPAYCVQIGSDSRVASGCLVSGHVIKELPGTSVMSCGKACRSEPQCQSFNLLEQDGGKRICQLNNVSRQAITEGNSSKVRGDCLSFDL